MNVTIAADGISRKPPETGGYAFVHTTFARLWRPLPRRTISLQDAKRVMLHPDGKREFTMKNFSTTVRMLHSGVVLHDCLHGSDKAAVQQRHAKLVADMAGVVGGTQTRVSEQGKLLSLIFVHDKALIEVTTS